MSEISQNIRYAEKGNPVDNPMALYDFVKPGRVVFDGRPPINASDGQNLWNWIDTSSGVWYQKEDGSWDAKYVIGGGGPPSGITGATNLGTGVDVFGSIVGTDLTFRSLVSSDGSVAIVQSADEIDLVSGNGTITGADSIGTGAEIYAGEATTRLEFRSLTSTSGRVLINQSSTEIDLDVSEIAAGVQDGVNAGPSDPIFIDRQADNLRFRTLTADTPKIVLTTRATDIGIDANITKEDVGLGFVQNYRNGVGSTTFEPDANTDSSQGFIQGSYYVQQGGELKVYICKDDTVGAAVWEIIYNGATPLPTRAMAICVGESQSGLVQSFSSSIVQPLNVGTSPGWTSHAVEGGWLINVNTGAGQAIRRVTPTDGQVDNLYQISWSLAMRTAEPSSVSPRTVVAGVYLFNFSGPAIAGSAQELSFAQGTAPTTIVSSVSNSSLFRAATNGAIDFLLGIRYPGHSVQGSFNAVIDKITLTITQV